MLENLTIEDCICTKADIEGAPDVAAVFRSTAEGETDMPMDIWNIEEVGDPVTGEPMGETEAN